MSIDEGDIFGKRLSIFNKTDWFKKKEIITKTREVANKIINSWKLEEKKELIKIEMKQWGFEEHIDEMINRLNEYNNIVKNELK